MICKKLQVCVDAELSGKHLRDCSNKNRNVCVESSDNRSSLKCQEKGKRYVLENTMKNQVISYKVDGGVVVEDKSVPAGTNKCDYLFVINAEEPVGILTELKGVDVPKALRQIYGTLLLFNSFFENFSHVYARAIVTSSTPNLKASPDYVKLTKLIRQKYKGNIKIIKQQLKEKDTDLSRE